MTATRGMASSREHSPKGKGSECHSHLRPSSASFSLFFTFLTSFCLFFRTDHPDLDEAHAEQVK